MIDVHGVQAHVHVAGRGPPALLVHGNAVTAEDWRESGVLAQLAASHFVVAPDRPGYGWSARPHARAWRAADQARFLVGLMDRLGPEPFLVIGHSLGAQIALRLALDWPERVRGLLLLSGFYFPTPRPDVAMSAALAAPVLGDVVRAVAALPAGEAIAGATLAQMFAPQRPPPGFRERVFEMSLPPGRALSAALDGARMAREARDMAPLYARITAPSRIVAGGDDRIVDPRQARRLARIIPGAELRIIPGAGHMLHHGAPRDVAQAARGLAQRRGDGRAMRS